MHGRLTNQDQHEHQSSLGMESSSLAVLRHAVENDNLILVYIATTQHEHVSESKTSASQPASAEKHTDTANCSPLRIRARFLARAKTTNS